jgi:hypothetical protein
MLLALKKVIIENINSSSSSGRDSKISNRNNLDVNIKN